MTSGEKWMLVFFVFMVNVSFFSAFLITKHFPDATGSAGRQQRQRNLDNSLRMMKR